MYNSVEKKRRERKGERGVGRRFRGEEEEGEKEEVVTRGGMRGKGKKVSSSAINECDYVHYHMTIT